MIRAAHHSGTQTKINRIVIHCTVSPCEPGWAVKIAKYFQSASAGGSAHYVVDPDEIVQCLPDNLIAWHAPPNTGSIGIELCDWQKGNPKRWQDKNHQDMLRRAAPLVRALANKYDIPLVWLTPGELRSGKRGICGHVDVSRAWGKTDHGDPHMGGPFPTGKFMTMIKDGVDDDMPSAKELWDHEIKVPWGTEANPSWQADSLLVEVNKKVREMESAIAILHNDMVELKAMFQNQLRK